MKRKIEITILLIVSILIINVDGTYAKTSKNLVRNPGFESSDFSMWKYKGTGMDKLDYYTEDPVGIWDKEDDCHSGDYTFHFWSTYKHHFRLEQTISKKKLNKKKIINIFISVIIILCISVWGFERYRINQLIDEAKHTKMKTYTAEEYKE